MAEQTIKVGTEFTEIQIPRGDFTLFLNQNSKYFFVSRSSNGDNAIFSDENLIFSGPATIYVKGDNPESYVILSDFFKTLPISAGGSTPMPGQTYSFNAPLVNSGGNISLALTQSLQITQNKLDLNLTSDQNFISLQQRVDQNTRSISTLDGQAVKLTGNQTIAGEKTFSGFSHFNNFVDVNVTPSTTYPFMLRFIGDKLSNNTSVDLIRFHKYDGACGYKVYVNGVGGFSYAELWGLTLISNMKDPTADSHGANKRYVDGKTGNLSQLSTTAKGNLVESINEVKADMPVVLPAGTQPTTSNVGSMKVAFVLK